MGCGCCCPTVAPTDVPVEGEDTETKTTLAAILAKVEAIPATIEAMLNNKLEPGDTDEDVENMKLPTSIADKFPFCIPFDVIYLVKAMNASSEVPRFELPFKIHYQNINYEHTFIVDMAEWDTAVIILRTMLDLLFIAQLISTTRELIRGNYVAVVAKALAPRQAVMDLLPDSPFRGFIDNIISIPYIGFLNYFVPISDFIFHLTAWGTATQRTMFSAILRTINAIDGCRVYV